MKSEFDLIHHYFRRAATSSYVRVGSGDDACVVRTPEGYEQIVTVDNLVEGAHFFSNADPSDLGWKALAVSLSDCAAMGARPAWVLMSLTLPEVDERWLEAFAQGFFACADTYDVPLVGGNMAKGPLNIQTTLAGYVKSGEALLRSGAQAGDDIYVSGSLGQAGVGLALLQAASADAQAHPTCLTAYHRPVPQVELGLELVGRATACIDVSDGFLQDLSHLLKTSGVGASIEHALLPRVTVPAALSVDPLIAGEDYELCFTAPSSMRDDFAQLADQYQLTITRVGQITNNTSIVLLDANNQPMPVILRGYTHF